MNRERLKLLYYAHAYGGVTTTFIRNELEYFSEKHKVLYSCQRIEGGGHIPDYVHVIPFSDSPVRRKIRWLLWRLDIACTFYCRHYSSRIKSFVDQFEPDVIHCHFGYEALALLDNIDYRRYKIVIHFHGYDATQLTSKKSYVRRLQVILGKSNVTAIVCCKYFGERLSNLTGLEMSKFKTLYYGIDVDKFKHSGGSKKTDERIFLQVSSLVPKKGHEYTLEAFARLSTYSPRINCKLIMTGDGLRRAALYQLAERLGIADRVLFVGNASPTRVIELLREADVFVHHSVTDVKGDMEGIPNSIIEAMAMELPIVSTRHSGITELVEDGVNGFLVREKDVADYSVRMFQALSMGRLSENRKKIVAEFNSRFHNEWLERFYLSLTRQAPVESLQD